MAAMELCSWQVRHDTLDKLECSPIVAGDRMISELLSYDGLISEKRTGPTLPSDTPWQAMQSSRLLSSFLAAAPGGTAFAIEVLAIGCPPEIRLHPVLPPRLGLMKACQLPLQAWGSWQSRQGSLSPAFGALSVWVPLAGSCWK